MTLLSCCQTACNETGFPVPGSIIGATANDVRHLLVSAQLTVNDLSKKPWTVLIKEHLFQTIANQPDYPLPADFGSLMTDTNWSRGDSEPSYALSPQNWQYFKSGVAEASAFDYWRIKVKKGVNRFYIAPTPGAVQDLVYEYRSNYAIRDADDEQTFKASFTKDGDVSLIDEDLVTLGIIWRFLKRQGEAYAEERDEYDHRIEIAMAQDGGSRTISFVKKSLGFVANVGQTGFNNYSNS